jgi:hypothetical protein
MDRIIRLENMGFRWSFRKPQKSQLHELPKKEDFIYILKRKKIEN